MRMSNCRDYEKFEDMLFPLLLDGRAFAHTLAWPTSENHM